MKYDRNDEMRKEKKNEIRKKINEKTAAATAAAARRRRSGKMCQSKMCREGESTAVMRVGIRSGFNFKYSWSYYGRIGRWPAVDVVDDHNII